MKCKSLMMGFVSALFVTMCASWGSIAAEAGSDDGLQKGEFIPTGAYITPSAAKGSLFQPLNPDLPFDPGFTVGHVARDVHP